MIGVKGWYSANQRIDGRELPGDADRGADRVGLSRQVVAGHLDRPGIDADQCREDLDDRRLSRTIRSQKGEDRPFGDVEVEPVEHQLRAERLAQAGDRDRGHVTAAGS
jgi:hypothetical protein